MTFTISAPRLSLTGDERAYIEFSFFSAVRSFEPAVRAIRVDVSRSNGSGGTDVVVCAERAGAAADPIVVRGSSERLYKAVDVAAQLLARAAEEAFGPSRRLQPCAVSQ